MALFLLVGCGGFIGSVSRYLLGTFLKKAISGEVPYSTVIINLIGSFIIGVMMGTIDSKTHPKMFYFIVTGILGGFTTFSAFSAESLYLIQKQLYIPAFIYLSSSVLGGLLLCGAGLWISGFLTHHS